MPGIGAKILEFISGKISEKGGDLVKNITGLVDEAKYSAEEKAAMEFKIVEAVNKYNLDVLSETTKQVLSEDQAITDRWKADMESDSWWSKNIRPLVLAFLMGLLFLMIAFDSAIGAAFEIKKEYIELVQFILETVIIAYFSSRGIEKFKSMHETTKQKAIEK